MTGPNVSGIERVVKNPTVTVVERVAVALQCTLGDLLDHEEELIVAKENGSDDSLLMIRQILADQILQVDDIPELSKVAKQAKSTLTKIDLFIDRKRKD